MTCKRRTAARAQPAYPSAGPIRLIVPFAPAGSIDILARIIADGLTRQLGQTVVSENRPGAGGNIGMGVAARAKPDGYTVLMHHIGMSTAPALYRKLPYDPMTDFEPIGLVNEVPMTFVAKKDFPAKDLKELIAYVKANQDKVNYANLKGFFGIGGLSFGDGFLCPLDGLFTPPVGQTFDISNQNILDFGA